MTEVYKRQFCWGNKFVDPSPLFQFLLLHGFMFILSTWRQYVLKSCWYPFAMKIFLSDRTCGCSLYSLAVISYHLFSFCGSLQDYKIHMDVEIVNTIHKSNKNICLGSQEVKSVYKCTAVLVTRPSMMFEDLI